VKRGGLWRLSAAGAVAALLVGCRAPRAERIQGKIAEAVLQGISHGSGTFDHSVWDGILQSYAIRNGRGFDYAGLKQEESGLDAYLQSLARADLGSLPRNELLALFVNAYNAYTVKTILAHVEKDGPYEIESIRNIPRVFEREIHDVGGFVLSLDNIEHNILRPIFRDPRIHFAVNCASVSCPPLFTRAFSGSRIDEQLDSATRRVLSSPDYVRTEDDKLLVTRILDWYGEDFVDESFQGAEGSLPAYINKFTPPEVRDWIESRSSTPQVEFMDYDWSLNRAGDGAVDRS